MAERFTCRLEDGLLQRATDVAERRGRHLSDVVRLALEAFLDRGEAGPAAHTPDDCIKRVLHAAPADMVAEATARAERVRLTLAELAAASLMDLWRDWTPASPPRHRPETLGWRAAVKRARAEEAAS